VLTPAYLGGYPQIEVAALTGVPLGTVKSRTFAAIRRLRTALHSAWAGETGGDTPGTTGAQR
jgi:RNA polymerase sigma-70 factor (ECF subfamily)